MFLFAIKQLIKDMYTEYNGTSCVFFKISNCGIYWKHPCVKETVTQEFVVRPFLTRFDSGRSKYGFTIFQDY